MHGIVTGGGWTKEGGGGVGNHTEEDRRKRKHLFGAGSAPLHVTRGCFARNYSNKQ